MCQKGIHKTHLADIISRCSKARVATNESIANDGRMVPAALDLPPGKLFFGFTYKPYDPKAATVKKVEPEDGAGVSDSPTSQFSAIDEFDTGFREPIFCRLWDDSVRKETARLQRQCGRNQIISFASRQRGDERGSLGEAGIWSETEHPHACASHFLKPSNDFWSSGCHRDR